MHVEERICSCGATFYAVPGVDACSLACAADARGLHQPQRRRSYPKASSTERGYGPEHRVERERWRPAVEAGETDCWRCDLPIGPDEPWDLGHISKDPVVYGGPEHVDCNRSAGARIGNASRRARRQP